MTPRTVLILCERAPVKVNPVPAVRYGVEYCPRGHDWRATEDYHVWRCSWCGRRVQVVA